MSESVKLGDQELCLINSNRIVEDLPRVLLAGNLTIARSITPNSTSVYASYNIRKQK